MATMVDLTIAQQIKVLNEYMMVVLVIAEIEGGILRIKVGVPLMVAG